MTETLRVSARELDALAQRGAAAQIDPLLAVDARLDYALALGLADRRSYWTHLWHQFCRPPRRPRPSRNRDTAADRNWTTDHH